MGRLEDMKKAIANKPAPAPKKPKEKNPKKGKLVEALEAIDRILPSSTSPTVTKSMSDSPLPAPDEKGRVRTIKEQIVHRCGHATGVKHFESLDCVECWGKNRTKRVANYNKYHGTKRFTGRFPHGTKFTDATYTDHENGGPRWDATLLVPGFEPFTASHTAIEKCHRALFDMWCAAVETQKLPEAEPCPEPSLPAGSAEAPPASELPTT